ncbi:MAG TPA: hypothetical protein DD628_00850, partial [Clostridiales bacterium]|nr:hypothetical protein [Candidatus Apopatosoma intestinale]
AIAGRSGHFVRTGRREATRGEIYKREELTHTRSVCVGVAETGGKALLYDFWYFWSYKSTIREK